jgi:serine protease Do
MQQVLRGAVCAAALLISGLATPAQAQVRGDLLTLVGPGSAIGVTVTELPTDAAAAAKVTSGVRVQTVQEGMPAARAGLKIGDIVVEFDGERVRSVAQFTRLVRETPPNRTVKATIVREGARQTLDVTPEAGRADNQWTTAQPFIQRFSTPGQDVGAFTFTPKRLTPATAPLQLGVSTIVAEGQLAAYFGVKAGVLVTAVEAGTPAATAGIRAGDVITSVGGRAIEQPATLSEAVRGAQPGAVLEIKLVRDKKEMTVKATLTERVRASKFRRFGDWL